VEKMIRSDRSRSSPTFLNKPYSDPSPAAQAAASHRETPKSIPS
jgi:hypothetical protein